MWRILAITLLTTGAWAQLATMETLPTYKNGGFSNGSSTVSPVSNVTSGNLEIVESWNSNFTTYTTISSTKVTTWNSFNSNSCSAASGPGNGSMQIFYGLITSSGAETVTFGRSQTRNAALEFTNVTATTDGTASGTYTGSTTATSPNLTPTVDGDLLFYANANCDLLLGAGGSLSIAPLQFLVNPSTDFVNGDFKLAGVSGVAYNASWTVAAGDHGAVAVVAFKPAAALQIATTKIPDMALANPCTFQMASNGGIGAVTWAVTGGALPPGCSMNSSGALSGTPVGSPPGTVTITATDTAAATASQTFTIAVGNSYATPAYVQTHSGVCTGGGLSLGSITPGDVLFVTRWSNVTGLSTNEITNNVGDAFAALPWTSGQGRTIFVYIGFLTAGATTLTCSTGAASSSVSATEFSNIQQTFEPTAWSQTFSSGGSSPVTSNAFVLPVTDLIFVNFQPNTGGTTVGAGSGFTIDVNNGGGNVINTEYKIGAAAGSSTASFTQSGNTDGHSVMDAGGFRPVKSGAAPVLSGHPRSQVY